MTEKIMNKDFIALLFVSILAVIAVVYGFTTIPSPAKQREFKLDHKRVSDLGLIQSTIESYYMNNHILPETLDVIEDNRYTYGQSLSKIDPENGQPYEYHVNGQTSYQLCATFITDSTQKNDYITYDTENYMYSSYKKKFEHSVGHKCFDFTVQRYNTIKDSFDRAISEETVPSGARIITLPIGSTSAQ